jgi:hypothetical protein
MTAPARISQADMERAAKAVTAAGIERARIVMDLDARKIEIIIGESVDAPASEQAEEWSDDDV